MALSGTMSNPNDWLKFYNLHNTTASSSQPLPLSSSLRHVISGQNQDQAAHHHDSTVVSTTPYVPNSAPLNPSSCNNNNNNNLSPEGRVSKPVRKRTRASRRTPTTLLNTDTANFRAMVQQFTGGPTTASSTFAPQPVAAAGFGFRQHQGFASNNTNPNINASMMMPPLRFNSNHQQISPYMISLNNNSCSNNIGDQNLNHPQGLVGRLMSSQTIRPVPNMGGSFSGDEISSLASRGQGQPPEQASAVGSGRRPNSNDSNENRSNSFLY